MPTHCDPHALSFQRNLPGPFSPCDEQVRLPNEPNSKFPGVGILSVGEKKSTPVSKGKKIMLIRRETSSEPFRADEGLGFECNLKSSRFKLKTLLMSSRPFPGRRPLPFSSLPFSQGQAAATGMSLCIVGVAESRVPACPLSAPPWPALALEGRDLAGLQG